LRAYNPAALFCRRQNSMRYRLSQRFALYTYITPAATQRLSVPAVYDVLPARIFRLFYIIYSVLLFPLFYYCIIQYANSCA
jgi:hypothetical protein